MTGRIHLEEAKRKMRENHANRSGKNNPMYGKNFSEEHRKKIGEKSKKFWEDPKHRQRMSEAHKGENNHMYGKYHSEETKRKISESLKELFKDPKNNPFYGRKHTEESKNKMSIAHGRINITGDN